MHSAPAPWSPSAWRSPAPHGEDACDDCTARGSFISITIGRRSLDFRPVTLMTSKKSRFSALHGVSSRIEVPCLLGGC
jgi:hypothetical protein